MSAVPEPEEGAQKAFDAGEAIFHHIGDSQMLELPFVGEVHLPTLHFGRVALPVTKHVVMMWVACAIIVLVRDELARRNIPHQGDRFVSYLLSTFVFILICNLLGLVPYGATPTGNIGVTAGLAGVAFLVIQAAGIREHGLVGHFKNLVPHGIPWPLVPIMVIVEFIGMLTKPFALCVRLFANMTGGHVVILS